MWALSATPSVVNLLDDLVIVPIDRCSICIIPLGDRQEQSSLPMIYRNVDELALEIRFEVALDCRGKESEARHSVEFLVCQHQASLVVHLCVGNQRVELLEDECPISWRDVV